MPSVFRPCIDLHNGAVKQIVGGTLDTSSLRTNFVSECAPLSRSHGFFLTPLTRIDAHAESRAPSTPTCTARTPCAAGTSSSWARATTTRLARRFRLGLVRPNVSLPGV